MCSSTSSNPILAARRVAPMADDVAASLSAMNSAHNALPRPEQAGSTIGIRRR